MRPWKVLVSVVLSTIKSPYQVKDSIASARGQEQDLSRVLYTSSKQLACT